MKFYILIHQGINLTEKQLYEVLKSAIIKTFDKRKTDIKQIDFILSEIEKSDFIKDMWNKYSQKYPYSHNINFNQILLAFEELKKYCV